jgi:putative membrane protein
MNPLPTASSPALALQANPARTPLSVVAAIIAISAGASLFLCWLVYYHAPTDVAGTHLLFLPALNAVLNGLAAVALIAGFRYIRGGRIASHRTAMFTAFIFSSVFLVTYIANHALHGDMRFHGQGPVRPFYFALLISHISHSVIAHRPVSLPPPPRPLHLSDLALCLGHGRHRLRNARRLSVT